LRAIATWYIRPPTWGLRERGSDAKTVAACLKYLKNCSVNVSGLELHACTLKVQTSEGTVAYIITVSPRVGEAPLLAARGDTLSLGLIAGLLPAASGTSSTSTPDIKYV